MNFNDCCNKNAYELGVEFCEAVREEAFASGLSINDEIDFEWLVETCIDKGVISPLHLIAIGLTGGRNKSDKGCAADVLSSYCWPLAREIKERKEREKQCG